MNVDEPDAMNREPESTDWKVVFRPAELDCKGFNDIGTFEIDTFHAVPTWLLLHR